MSDNNMNADKTMLRVGSTLQMGKYRIEKYLSSGGFGNTYMGINVFDEQVAIKEFFMKDVNQRVDDSTAVSLSNITQMPIFQEQMEKFKKEAKRLRNLHSPHIVAVSDLFDENGTTYYVMDYIDGQSLRDMVQQRGKLVEQEVLDYLNQTLDALEVVHNQGIFHLDLKPANLMVDKKGILRIIDFGASKQQKSDGGATSRSAICYSPGYAPIEQKDQEFQNFGPWTDLYALGATLYNVLTGKTPPSTSKISDFGEKAFEFPPTVSKKMQELAAKMEFEEAEAIKKKLGIVGHFILFVGSLEPRKNLQFLLSLMPEVYKRIGRQLVVVGAKGWKNSGIREIVESNDFPRQSTVFCGYVSNEELARLYNMADCFVSASLNEGAHGKKGAITVQGYDARVWTEQICEVCTNRPSVDISQFASYDWDSILEAFLQYLSSK